jgi:predicted metal-dependent hydrolase
MNGMRSASGEPASVVANGERFDFRLRRTARRSLAIYVYPDGSVELRLPREFSQAVAEAFLRERLDWVRERRRRFAEQPLPSVPRHVEGERHRYLGEEYVLCVRDARPQGVWLTGSELIVQAAGPVPERVAALLDGWYRRQAARVLPERLELGYRRMAHLGIPRPSLRIRVMRTRWGSCSRRGGVNLNRELIKYPLELVDYVVVHELCHLLEFNHGPGFYALMDAVLPDWPARKARLNALARGMTED